MARADARLSTYSGAPSLQPSLAPTLDTQSVSNRDSTQRRASAMTTTTISEKRGMRASVYANSYHPSARDSSSTLGSSDPRAADIKTWSGALERMQDARLDKQRYVMSGNKSEEVSKLALGAKVERALARRMTGQDAVFSVKKPIDAEKAAFEVRAN